MSQSTEIIKVQPGTICVYKKPVRIASVISFGIAVSLYDPDLKIGGLCHYLYPSLPDNVEPSGKYAFPALHAQIKLLEKHGSVINRLEANLYGGTEHPNKDPQFLALAKKNLQVGLEFLKSYNIQIGSLDIGGNSGRKLVFNAITGESIVAKVRHLRLADWQVA
ncbi:MAG: hypothetical protein COA79_05260 [Planctomycetota bacterium]|nr:MAG: hypothetical protein COA79_05260 [Planctomycetota bacterium]